jgi:hydroxyacid-oxoacid transhydrogenase
MDSSSIKFGVGATREVGDDMQALALQSLRAAGIDAVLYDRVRVEPTDASFQDAIRFATEGNFDIGSGR